MLNGNVWWIGIRYEGVGNCKSTSSKLTGIWHGTLKKNRHFSRHFGTLAWFSDCFDRFWCFKMCTGHFSRTLRRSGLKQCRYCIPQGCIYPIFGYLFAWPLWPGDLRWPWPPLGYQGTDIYTWVQMSDTLSLVICWLCLRHFDISTFWSLSSAGPKRLKNYFQMTCDAISDLKFKCFTFSESSRAGAWVGGCLVRDWYFLVSCRPYDGGMSWPGWPAYSSVVYGCALWHDVRVWSPTKKLWVRCGRTAAGWRPHGCWLPNSKLDSVAIVYSGIKKL